MKNFIFNNIDFIAYAAFFSFLLILFFCALSVPVGTAFFFGVFIFVMQFFSKMIFNFFFRFLRRYRDVKA